ncbi:EamA family transporter [Bacillus kexueae]|uniref:EamA family transporter n=1 Tax=Aeribacillus kexueae TaxID=2078952 RepID=UPI001FAE8137|nr:EamA family transporter [Bacillus kexueae]
MSRHQAILLALLAAILWGTTGTTQAFAPEDTNPLGFGAIRLLIGGGTLLVVVLLQRKFQLQQLSFKAVFIASISMACYQPFFFSAVKLTGIAVGTVVGIGSSPILAGIIEWALLKKKPRITWFYATACALVGCFFLFQNEGPLIIHPLGVMLAIGAGLSFAVYTIASKQLIANHDSNTVVAAVFTFSAILLFPILFFIDMSWLFTLRGIGTSIYIGVFATGLSYLLFAKGLTVLPSSTAVTLALAEPLTATLLGAFVIGEVLSTTVWIGIFLLLCSILLLSYEPKKKLLMDAKGG